MGSFFPRALCCVYDGVSASVGFLLLLLLLPLPGIKLLLFVDSSEVSYTLLYKTTGLREAMVNNGPGTGLERTHMYTRKYKNAHTQLLAGLF